MNEQMTYPAPLRRLTSRRLIAFALVALVVMSVAAFLVYQRVSDARDPRQIPISKAIEDRYGVRLTFLALTARDGLIDMRYRVIDPAKARDFGHYSETTPMIVAEDTGEIISVTEMGLHNHRVQPGLIFHVLFRNTGNAVQHGRPVTIRIGDIELNRVYIQ